MFIKKLYNDLDTLVDEAMAGSRLIADDAEKYSRVLPNSRITVRRDKYKKPKGLVKLVGGGGAGHEGPPGTFIRPGGFDGMTTGDVFAAPSARQLFRMIQEIDDGSPIIMNVARHAGDVLNSTLCKQLCEANGINNVYLSIGGNDVASAPKERMNERRGSGGALSCSTVMAECGESVEEILRMAEKCNSLQRSYGVGIRPAIHPTSGLLIMGDMPEDEIEMGIGVHGESSGKRIKLPRSHELAQIVLDILLTDMPVPKGEDIVFNLGGLGGMTWTELDILYKDCYEILTYDYGLNIWRHRVGNSGTQELGGFTMSIGWPDDEIKKWMTTRIPMDNYPKD
ncbi:MAG: dihydroxyacetone kinase subunit DhaK [Oscillospiraceae bacterium]|nr:dihydroxyacetone kinase subunit DhaK [Oscillospiraceae bacterium]